MAQKAEIDWRLGEQARELRNRYVSALTAVIDDRVHWLAEWSLDAARLLDEIGQAIEEPPF